MVQGFKTKAPKAVAPGKSKSTATRAKLQPKDVKKGGEYRSPNYSKYSKLTLL